MAGEPSMDEILASIRKIISEDVSPRLPAVGSERSGPPPTLPFAAPRRGQPSAETAPQDISAAPAMHGPTTADVLSELVDQLTNPPLATASSAVEQGKAASLAAAFGGIRPYSAAPSAMDFQRAPLPPLFGEPQRSGGSEPAVGDRVRPMDLEQLRPARSERTPGQSAASALDAGVVPVDAAVVPTTVAPDLEPSGGSLPDTPAGNPESVLDALLAGHAAARNRPVAPVSALDVMPAEPVSRRDATPPADAQSVATAAVASAPSVGAEPHAPAAVPTLPNAVAAMHPVVAAVVPDLAGMDVPEPAAGSIAPVAPESVGAVPSALVAVATGLVAVDGASADAGARASTAPAVAAGKSVDHAEPVAAAVGPVVTALAGQPSVVGPAAAAGATEMPVAVAAPSTVPANRGFEDAVSEMLRPMLRQWLDANMPKLVEKALASEMATMAATMTATKTDSPDGAKAG